MTPWEHPAKNIGANSEEIFALALVCLRIHLIAVDFMFVMILESFHIRCRAKKDDFSAPIFKIVPGLV